MSGHREFHTKSEMRRQVEAHQRGIWIRAYSGLGNHFLLIGALVCAAGVAVAILTSTFIALWIGLGVIGGALLINFNNLAVKLKLDSRMARRFRDPSDRMNDL